MTPAPRPVSPEAVTTVTVNVITTGTELAERWFQGRRLIPPPAASEVAASRRNPVDHDDMDSFVRAMMDTENIDCHAYMLTVDCRGFADPEALRRRRREGINHIGTDETILHRLVLHNEFAPLWLSCIQRLNRRLPGGDLAGVAGGSAPSSAPATVVFFCKKGRHRSVGMAWLTAQLLLAQGYNVVLRHTMRDFWALGTCNECRACASSAASKMQIYNRARGLLPHAFIPPRVGPPMIDV